MRVSINKLRKLRAGQSVWRVLFHVGQDGRLAGTVSFAQGQGRRRLHLFNKGEAGQWSSMYFDYPISIDMNSPAQYLIRFLSDAHGDGAFTSRRSAQRYIDDVLAGRYPEVERWVRESERFTESMPSWLDYDEEFDDWAHELLINESNEPMIPFHEDDGRLYSDSELDFNQSNNLI